VLTSPARTEYRSSDQTHELDRLARSLSCRPSYLAWDGTEPLDDRFYTPDELRAVATLDEIDTFEDATLFEIRPPGCRSAPG
jgi:hypothetical protein